MGKLKFGVIGAAGGRASGWAEKVKQWGDVEIFDMELTAICDINKQAVETKAKRWGVKAYTDYNEMFKQENLDAVIIGTPHYLHARQAIAAAENDINVLVEKPMCINLKQADEMRKAVKMNDIKLAVGFQHRYNPNFMGLKKAIDDGDLGNIFQINMFARHYRSDMYYETSTQVDPSTGVSPGNWRGRWETEGAGALANQIVHFLDVFQWLAPSPIKSVSAISRVAKHNFTEVDDNTNAIVEFMDGSMGNIQSGVAYEHGEDTEFGIYGTNGTLIHRKDMINNEGKKLPYLDFRTQDLMKKKPVDKYKPSVLNGEMQMFGDFVEAIEEDDASLIKVDVEEGRKSVELMRGILMSIILEKKVSFPLHDVASMVPSLAHTYRDPMFYE